MGRNEEKKEFPEGQVGVNVGSDACADGTADSAERVTRACLYARAAALKVSDVCGTVFRKSVPSLVVSSDAAI